MAVGSFNQKISLEGAEEILRQLQQLGAQGERAFQQLKTAVEAPNTNLSRLNNSLNATKAAFGQVAVAANALSGSLGPVGQSIATVTGLLSTMRGSALAGAAAVAGAAILMARNFANSVVETTRMAKALGLSVEQLQGLQKVAKDAGLDVDTLNGAITRFSGRVSSEAQDQFKALIDIAKQVSTQLGGGGIKIIDPQQFQQLREAATQAAPAIRELFRAAGDPRANLPTQQFIALIERLARTSEEFRNQLRQAAIPVPPTEPFERFDVLLEKNKATLASMGVALVDAKGNFRSTGDVLLDALDKLQQMPEGFQRTARSAQLFGRQAGPELAQALTRGGLDAAIQKLREAGRVFDADAIQKAQEARKAFNDFDASAGKLSKTLGSAVLPSITRLLQGLDREISGQDQIFSIEPGSIADSIIKAFESAIPFIQQFWTNLKSQAIETWNEISADAQSAWTFIQSLFTSDFWVRVFNSAVTAAQAAWNAIVQGAQAVPGLISGALASVGDAIVSVFSQAAAAVARVWQGIVDLIQRALNLGRQQAAQGGGGGGFAGGGYTGGAGVRQIAGFVHGQEYVQPAHVVRQPGVRAFLEMLRRNGGDLQSAINRFSRGFSSGGFVDSISSSLSRNFAIPGYASGGFVQPAARSRNLGTLHLSLNGERLTVMTDESVAAKLSRFASKSEIASGGRKPSGYRG